MTMNEGARLAGRQYLTFRLGDEDYAFDILRVREIRVWEGATRIPRAAAFIKGVINLRGTIVPVIDLRERFGLPEQTYGPRTVMIVLGVQADDGERLMAVIVDAVADVQRLGEAETAPPPEFGTAVHTHYITGLATVDGRMLVLLDSDRLLDLDEMQALAGLDNTTTGAPADDDTAASTSD